VKIRGQGDFVTFLESQDYDAKGQRQFARYGNDIITNYFYDPKTFRLVNLVTKRAGTPDTQNLQDLHYTFDPVGNIVHTRDDAQQTHYFNNSVVKPEHEFEYDATYQLLKATGREHAGLGGNAQRDDSDLPFLTQLPHANDVDAVRRYTELYEYDDCSNISRFQHIAANANWTRLYRYEYQDDSSNNTNRLKSTSLPGDPEAGPFTASYQHDIHGNMVRMPHLNEMVWNFMDQLTQVDLGGGGTAFYVFGLGGTRMRKVVERLGGKRTERIYLGAVEIYREYQNETIKLERSTLHVSDNTGKIAQVDTKLLDPDDTDSANPLNKGLIRYQYSNHLGSATLETNNVGIAISYEEYHPYGTSAYRSSKSDVDLSLKRYRFSGKERDVETGLYYFGARYYAVWLGRWTSSDPAGFVSGLNLYRYCSNNPINLHDPNGKKEKFPVTIPKHLQDEVKTDTDPARAALDAHFRGKTRTEDKQLLQFRTGSHYWSGPHKVNVGIWDPVVAPTPSAPAEEKSSPPVSNPVRPGITAVNAANQATSPSGQAMKGSLNLWSRDEAVAQAAEGYVLRDTTHQQAIEAEVAGKKAAKGSALDWQTEERPSWAKGSRQLSKEGALSGKGVRSHGLSTHSRPAGTIQSQVEIPTVRKWGAGMTALGGASGVLTIYSASQVENTIVRYIGYGAGAGEILGATAYGVGLAMVGKSLASARVMSLGTGLGRFAGGYKITLPAYLHAQ